MLPVMRPIATLAGWACCTFAVGIATAVAPAGVPAGVPAPELPPLHASANASPSSSDTSCAAPASVCDEPVAGSFALIRKGQTASLLVDASDYQGVVRAAHDLGGDLSKVAGTVASITAVRGTASAAGYAGRVGRGSMESEASSGAHPPILIGTLGHSPLIDRLVRLGKLDVTGVRGRWEAYTQVPTSAARFSRSTISRAESA